jgi:hypothetical protein
MRAFLGWAGGRRACDKCEEGEDEKEVERVDSLHDCWL